MYIFLAKTLFLNTFNCKSFTLNYEQATELCLSKIYKFKDVKFQNNLVVIK